MHIYNLTGALTLPTIDLDQISKRMRREGEVISH